MRKAILLAPLLVSLALLPGSPAAADDETVFEGGGADVSFGGLEVQGGTVRVTGSIATGGYFYLDFDPVRSGVNAPGTALRSFEIVDWGFMGHVSFNVGLENGTLLLPPPPVLFSWPFEVDGRNEGRWLGAGAPGTGLPPATSFRGWGGVCGAVTVPCEPIESSGLSDYHERVFWFPTYADLGAAPGSTIKLGTANGGVVSSFAWPVTPTADGTGALSTLEGVPTVKLQGEVRLGIAPAGTPADQVAYPVRATLGTIEELEPTDWSGELARPALPGSYELHAQTCWGRVGDLDCDHVVAALTI